MESKMKLIKDAPENQGKVEGNCTVILAGEDYVLEKDRNHEFFTGVELETGDGILMTVPVQPGIVDVTGHFHGGEYRPRLFNTTEAAMRVNRGDPLIHIFTVKGVAFPEPVKDGAKDTKKDDKPVKDDKHQGNLGK